MSQEERIEKLRKIKLGSVQDHLSQTSLHDGRKNMSENGGRFSVGSRKRK